MEQISISHVKKIYYTGDVETVALDDISFSIKKGEFVAIVAPRAAENQPSCMCLVPWILQLPELTF